MASIYANAYFTIVAAEGTDAEFGLRGIQITSGPRNYDPYFRFKDISFCIWQEEERGSKWHTRAWTFQERALSKRAMVLFQQTVKWECQVKEFDEQTDLSKRHGEHLSVGKERGLLYDAWYEQRKASFPWYNISITMSPDVPQFIGLWFGFSGRELSYQEDSLKAFSAIINVFSASFPGGFIYALPELAFDIALTWHHSGEVGRRRRMFPSWSWLGWEGALEMGDWDPTIRPKLRTFREPLAQ
ncbi:uncharacterized protein BDZ99DRAFT_522784 [Mytilinidion resinicola]|uniref:Heterokaryon incompatibility domain-containing protein n=1 Tax=Mytilinidion resinicola TaxID=574789 RepID=A0A6A6YGJ6_9PEZI|nr:uncharacterized protein BDZ99DRAFT_522784 [Mytilinidion resinicola]KAF2807155.1 hypothetical protein BDZ99DRAFT_522784 [Mytilinidion resinicola]